MILNCTRHIFPIEQTLITIFVGTHSSYRGFILLMFPLLVRISLKVLCKVCFSLLRPHLPSLAGSQRKSNYFYFSHSQINLCRFLTYRWLEFSMLANRLFGGWFQYFLQILKPGLQIWFFQLLPFHLLKRGTTFALFQSSEENFSLNRFFEGLSCGFRIVSDNS